MWCLKCQHLLLAKKLLPSYKVSIIKHLHFVQPFYATCLLALQMMKTSRTTKLIALACGTLLCDLSLPMRDSSAFGFLVVITFLVVVTRAVVFLVVVALVVGPPFPLQLGSQYPQLPCTFWCE